MVRTAYAVRTFFVGWGQGRGAVVCLGLERAMAVIQAKLGTPEELFLQLNTNRSNSRA
jgi:hypothetical protein